MGTPYVLTDDDVLEVKANVQHWTINQWAKHLGVTYRTIQKIVTRESYRDLGVLAENWFELREKQMPGRKPGGMNRKANPSPLEGREEEALQLYHMAMNRIAERLGVTAEEFRAFVANHGREGLRKGRNAKLNTLEVTMIRQDLAAGASYKEIAERYGISRPLIAKVGGRGKHNANSYVPSDYEAPVTPQVTSTIEPSDDDDEVHFDGND